MCQHAFREVFRCQSGAGGAPGSGPKSSALARPATPSYRIQRIGPAIFAPESSYGFRPKRNQHQALDALAFGIGKRRINWVLDCDVQSFFDKVDQNWLVRFVEHRIGDRRIIRLIAKWLTAGVLEDGRLIETEEGTPQGAVISPLLANIYLHHVYDQWVHQWRQRCATGDVIVVRYADDSIVGFEHRYEAEQFLAEARSFWTESSSREDAAHRVWAERNCEPPHSRPR